MNWLEIQKEAFARTQGWVQGYVENPETSIDNTVNEAYCPIAGLESPSDIFAVKKKGMLADFTARFNTFDVNYKIQLEQLAKDAEICNEYYEDNFVR